MKSSTDIFVLTRGAEPLSSGCVRLPRCRVKTWRETSSEQDRELVCGLRARVRTTVDPGLAVTGLVG